MKHAADPDVGEIERAVRGADRPFGEGEPFLHQLRGSLRRHHARNAPRGLRARRPRNERNQAGEAEPD